MSVERLKAMKDSIISCVEGQMSDLKNVDAHELGEAIDMIKDFSEAIYYCTVTEAMEDKGKEEKYPIERNNTTYYTERMIPYYDDGWNKSDNWKTVRYMGPNTYGEIGNSKNISYYEDGMNNTHMTGISPHSRKMYMEAKDMHQSSAVQMQELENYMKDLSKDITDMISDASSEEKLLLQQKLLTLANKIKPNVNASSN